MSRSQRSRSTFVTGANAALTILFVMLLGAAVIVHYGIKQYDAAGPLQAETDIAVPKGSGTRDIAEKLQQAGAIDNSSFTENLFLAAERRVRHDGRHRVGAANRHATIA